MKRFHVDNKTYITYDPDAHAFYIYLSADEDFSGLIPWTETVQDVDQGPLINVDRIGDTVIGIEICT